MTLARTYGIPRSRLLGRQPRSVTTFQYDDGGRLVRAVTVQEAEWLEEDRDWAAAQLQEERNKCPGCGLSLDETVGPANEGQFEAPPPQRCHACSALSDRKRQWAAMEGVNTSDLLFHVHRKA